jgi:hypothetical protein
LGTPSEIGNTELDNYISENYQGKLTDVKLGNNTSWTQTELDGTLKLSWQVSQLKLQQAIEVAPINLVLAEFRKLKV